MTLVPILVYTVLHHPEWLDFANIIEGKLAGISNEAIRNQMRGPLVLAALLPKGLLGAFAALMMGAFISTHNTYLHSWSSIFIQDVVLPLRKKPLSEEAHLRLLRGGVIGVAVFIFMFSLLYKQSQAILLFFALTGAIFAGWSGAVIIGGLYTRWGTTAGAWAAGISGVSLTMVGFILEQTQRVWRDSGVAFWGLLDFMGPENAVRWAEWVSTNLPNGQQMWGWAMWSCSLIYIGVSLVQQAIKKQPFNLDKLLHRGEYVLAGEVEEGDNTISKRWRALGINNEFTKGDKYLYLATYGWTIAWVILFIIGTIFFLTRNVENGDWSRWNPLWLKFWLAKIWLELAVAAVVIVWFTLGGIRDVKAMLAALDRKKGL